LQCSVYFDNGCGFFNTQLKIILSVPNVVTQANKTAKAWQNEITLTIRTKNPQIKFFSLK
jgi:hypothetical protein